MVINLVNDANYDVTLRVWGKDAKVEIANDLLREYGVKVANDAESKRENAVRLYIGEAKEAFSVCVGLGGQPQQCCQHSGPSDSSYCGDQQGRETAS